MAFKYLYFGFKAYHLLHLTQGLLQDGVMKKELSGQKSLIEENRETSMPRRSPLSRQASS